MKERHALAASCLVTGSVAAALLLLVALFDLTFETDLVGILSQATLAAFACALIIATWAQYEDR